MREVLEMGSGGGHNTVHLEARFAMTLVDLSEDMLTVSRRLNPRATTIRATRARCGSAAPYPADTWTLTEYAFLLRDADGSVHVVHETHRQIQPVSHPPHHRRRPAGAPVGLAKHR